MNIGRHLSVAAGVAVCASAFAFAPALATPGSGFTPSGIVTGHYGKLDVKTESEKYGQWGMMLKTKDDTDIGADRLTVVPGGVSGWHSHPAAVFVTVMEGSIAWTDGTDPVCPTHNYSAGDSFMEPANHIHNVTSAGGAVFIAVHINPAGTSGPAFRVDEGEPTNC